MFQDSEFNDHLIVFYKLRDLSDDGSTENQLHKLLEHIQQQIIKHMYNQNQILLFLDGLDAF
jgi:hypothetical protein